MTAVPLPATSFLEDLQALYDRGLLLTAHRAASAFAAQEGRAGRCPYSHWKGAPALVLARRLCLLLGAPRRAELLLARALEADPTDPAARYYAAYGLLARRGPYAALVHLRREGMPPGASPEIAGSWLALQASALAALRDFERAWECYGRALKAAPDSPWVLSRRAELLAREDRHEEALAHLREVLKARPWYRPAVGSMAHELASLDRVGEAVELLQEASAHLEAADVTALFADLLEESGRWEEASRAWERYAELSPLLENRGRRWLDGRRSDVAYQLGDLPGAIRFARRSGGGFFAALVSRLESLRGDEKVVRLPVPFVRQHHMTCAPATVAMLSAYWGRPIDHRALAEEICWNGTPDHLQRDWVERHGWISRPFTVTWEAAVALLDRGVPFALGTREPTSGHLQAVVGYDARRHTLLLRDPGRRGLPEAEASAFLEHYRPCGPRGTALVPREESHRLEGLELPDTALYDLEHRLRRALAVEDRPGAGRLWEELAACAPRHWLTHQTRAELAAYDGDDAARLAALEELIALFPHEPRFALERLGCLRELSREEDRLRQLRDWALSPRGGPWFWEQYAEELRHDARDHPRAQRLLRRTIAAQPANAMAYHILADLLWGCGERDEPIELYRLAACLDDKDEHLAYAVFSGMRAAGRVGEGLAYLVGRARGTLHRSSDPVLTAFRALDELERQEEGFALLDDALSARPKDPDLLLFAAREYGCLGRLARAEQLLEEARPLARPTLWARAAAFLARRKGDAARAEALWQEIAAAEPRALDARRELAKALADRAGPEAAIAYLTEWAERFPHFFAAWQLVAEWKREAPLDEAERWLRRMLESSPRSAWTWRELAWNLERQRRHEESEQTFASALALEPNSPGARGGLARVLRETGRIAEARRECQVALTLSADSDFAFAELLALSRPGEERRAALAFLHAELMRQNCGGDGIDAWCRAAQGILEPQERLAGLRALVERHPTLWQPAVGLVRQLAQLDLSAEALDRARETAFRFPLLPRAWLELAAVARLQGDRQEERAALDKALEINPGWSEGLRQLAEWHDAGGDLAEARRVLERAVARAPREAVNHGCLADVLWRQGERDAAVREVEQAARLDPDYGWAWEQLARWSDETGGAGAAARLAKELSDKSPGDVLVWRRVADWGPSLEERLAALDRITTLAPGDPSAYAVRVTMLADAGRIQEALAAAKPEVFGESLPFALRRAAAHAIACSGDLQGASGRIRELLAEDPVWVAGWRQLADWADSLQDWPAYLEAARRLVALRPADSESHGYLAHALRMSGDRSGAKSAFLRAHALDRHYPFAAMWVFELALEDGELEAARGALAALEGTLEPPLVLERRIKLACRDPDFDQPGPLLRSLTTAPGVSADGIERAVKAMDAAGRGDEANAILSMQLTEAESAAACGAAWVSFHAARRSWEALVAAIDGRLRGTKAPAALQAAANGLEELVSAGELWKAWNLLDRCRDWFQAHDPTWGATGYALYALGRFRDAIRWLSGWKRRPDLQDWMVVNLVASLQALGQIRESILLAREVLALDPPLTLPRFRLLAALGDALEGRREPAFEACRQLEGEQLPQDAALTRALVLVVACAGEGAGASSGRRKLEEAREQYGALARAPDDAARYRYGLRRVTARGPRGLRVWGFFEALGLSAVLGWRALGKWLQTR